MSTSSGMLSVQRSRDRVRHAVFGACLIALGLAACGSSTSTETGTNTPDGCPAIAPPRIEDPTPPDGASACAAGSCNYESQSGCAASQACRPQFDGTNPVVNPGCESAGTGVSGTMCSQQTDCAAGYFCVGKQCHKLCCGNDWSACPDGESCFTELDVPAGAQHIPSGADVCYPVNNCDAFATGGCPSGRECKIVDPRGSLACTAVSAAHEGDSCSAPNFCAQGLICLPTGPDTTSPSVCRKLCRAEVCGTPACTAAEGKCQHFSRDPAGVGECTPGL